MRSVNCTCRAHNRNQTAFGCATFVRCRFSCHWFKKTRILSVDLTQHSDNDAETMLQTWISWHRRALVWVWSTLHWIATANHQHTWKCIQTS